VLYFILLFPTGFDKLDGNDKQKDEPNGGNNKTTVIVVCVLIITFVIGIVAFFGYRKKNR
jgi:flagellar basal body-associated protein FliL